MTTKPTKPTEKQILEILGTDPRYISRAQIGWVSRAQIGWVSRAQIGWVSPAQIGGLSPDQMSWLSPDHMSVIEIVKNPPTLENPYTQILAKIQGSGKLEMKTWHTCETTHCVGGWTVFLTPGGKELESKFDTATAARIILSASRPDAPLPNFTASNEAAMAFIEARAEEEK